MALNFADLFEHAVDAFADRTAVACGDRQVTYRELEERTNQLAHHLAGLRVGPGDHVGLYARNSVEAIETLIAACKLRAAAVNINYRYVENELRYMFADSDLTALVYDRRLAPVVAAAASAAPGLRGLVEIDDGSPAPDTAKTAMSTTDYDEAVAAASPERDFPARSGDDVYIIYTGGTTGYPKGVLWRHEDIWRTLAGGMDFVTGEPLPDEWAQSRKGYTCVNTGGEKVFPEEVEAALKSHPDVFDALVIGMPDERLGQRVAALVQPRPGAAPDLAALAEHVRGQIAGYKVPRSIWLTDAIRRTVSGKADYGWARQYAAGHPPGLDLPAGHARATP